MTYLARLGLCLSVLVCACNPEVDLGRGGKNGGTAGGPAADDPGSPGQTSCGTPEDKEGCTCAMPGQTRACFRGPLGTRGLGLCVDGAQACAQVGEFTAWGPCVGTGQPAVEQCGGGGDEDCDGLADCADSDCAQAPGCQPPCQSGQTGACYTGPAGTSGVGLCKPGSMICTAASAWGSCMGEVKPVAEVCNDGIDNDCSGLADCADPACASAPGCCTPQVLVYAHSATELYRVDPTSYAVTKIGNFGAGDEMTDLAVTPNGDLYTISYSTLYKVNKTTAQATAIASLNGGSYNGLTFLANGQLLASSQGGDVKRMNPMTASQTTLGNYGSGLSSSGDLVGVGNTMYGISASAAGGADASDNNRLLTVDVTTGKATVVGPIGHGYVFGLAYVNARVLAFTADGKIIEVNPATGQGTLLTSTSVPFWGAGTSPLVCP